MNDLASVNSATAAPSPMMVPVEAYISPDYARAEKDRLWSKVWQVACREEELTGIGDYVTYDIADESIIVTRTDADTITAYYNVCPHRGRRLTGGCGNAARFHCKYHGWQWNIDGSNAYVRDREDWGGSLTDDFLRLRTVRVGRWAGYVFVNLDPEGESFEDFLGTLPQWLDPFEIGKMRYKWRQWLRFPCNWKVAIEAFIESYHVAATHSQLLRWGDLGSWTRAEGRHSVMGVCPRGGREAAQREDAILGQKAGQDARVAVAEYLEALYNTVGLGACTTETVIGAAKKLVDVLPEDASAFDVGVKMMELAAAADAERGIEWPVVDGNHLAQSGIDWHVFPNSIILHGMTHILGYRVRPDGDNPDSCIFEGYALERFPEGEEPRPANVYEPEVSEAKWQLVLMQDFHNMPEVQKGMKSRGLAGLVPSPVQEESVTNFHRNLSDFMGTGAPHPFPAA